MLRRNTIRILFRFLIYVLLSLLLFTSLNILHEPESSLEATKYFFSSLKNPLFRHVWRGSSMGFEYPRPSTAVQENLFLDTGQCQAAFPNFDKEVKEAMDSGPFALKRIKDNSLGPAVQGRIKDGKLYIVSAEKDLAQAAQQYRDAVLHQLYRAMITTPTHEPLPDTVFSFNVIDNPRENTWSFSRSADSSTLPNQWLMPHFSYWSWPYPFIQAFDIALSKIAALESLYTTPPPPPPPYSPTPQTPLDLQLRAPPLSPWLSKIDKLVWRGTAWYNPISNTDLRKSLLRTTKNKEWADVLPLHWIGNPGHTTAENLLEIEEFCRYRYIVYTEGITYSGRLPFHRACASVVISTPIGFLQHTSWLIRPIWARDLIGDREDVGEMGMGMNGTGNELWPKSWPVEEANMVFVKWDWSELEDTVLHLREHPDIAERIARNQRNLMVEGGYLSPAAEVCYWRALVRGWSEMVRPDETWGVGKNEELGMRWEVFELTKKTKFEE